VHFAQQIGEVTSPAARNDVKGCHPPFRPLWSGAFSKRGEHIRVHYFLAIGANGCLKVCFLRRLPWLKSN